MSNVVAVDVLQDGTDLLRAKEADAKRRSLWRERRQISADVDEILVVCKKKKKLLSKP